MDEKMQTKFRGKQVGVINVDEEMMVIAYGIVMSSIIIHMLKDGIDTLEISKDLSVSMIKKDTDKMLRDIKKWITVTDEEEDD